MAKNTEYDIQAEKWLTEYGIRMEITYVGHRKYFPGDEDTRDVYSVTMISSTHRYSFEFGQSLYHSFRRHESRGKYWSKLANNERIRGKPQRLSAYDVLASMDGKYFSGLTFEDWCCEWGHNTDSRSALEGYLNEQKAHSDLLKLLNRNDKALRALQEIQ